MMVDVTITDVKPGRFWAKAVITPSGCVEWTGYVNRDGYGQVNLRVDGTKRGCMAHRVAWVLAGYQLIPGLQLDHLCRNKACINVEHLEQVTSRINTSRSNNHRAPSILARLAGRCVNGHVLSEVGEYANGQCAACGRENVRRYKQRRRLAGVA